MKTASRNICILFISTLCFFTLFSSPSQADSGAKQVLQKAVDQVLIELQKPELHSLSGRPAIIQHVEKIVYQLFDFEELSARTVGATWRTFTPDQKTRFIAAFTGLLKESYLEKLEDYDDGKVEYKGEVASSDGKRVEVQTSVIVKDKSIPVAYRMIHKKDWVVYDVNIEGVGMVQNYRKQFQDVLAKGDIESLISLVEKKAKDSRNSNKKEQLSQ